MVLLHHELPDHSSHFDWMLQRADNPHELLTFRLNHRIDLPADTLNEFTAERLIDHRAIYLEYEGPVQARAGGDGVSNDSFTPPHASHLAPETMGARGRVRRLASGTCTIHAESPSRVALHTQFLGQPAQHWLAERADTLSGSPSTPQTRFTISESSPELWHFRLFQAARSGILEKNV